MSKKIKIAIAVILIFVIGETIYLTHPIIYKWLSGDAKIVGKPIDALVYTNGQLNNGIKVYSDNEGQTSNDYILELKESDKDGMLKYINIDLKNLLIGRPVSTNSDDYDIINGQLLQSDVGSHFIDFKDDIKGFNFDPHLVFANKEIKFDIPPKWLTFNSIKIQLP